MNHDTDQQTRNAWLRLTLAFARALVLLLPVLPCFGAGGACGLGPHWLAD